MNNVLYSDENLMAVQIDNNYSLQINEISNRYPKLISKKIDEILDKVSTEFGIDNVMNPDVVYSGYAYQIFMEENQSLDKNNNVRTNRNYKIKFQTVSFTSKEELVKYLTEILINVKYRMSTLVSFDLDGLSENEVQCDESLLDFE